MTIRSLTTTTCAACCGRVDDVEVPNLAGLEEEAARTSGNQICGHTLQFDGICPECQKS